ncbi:MAG: hypothetical protein ABL900_16885 [Burkholderiaceae bacterium]
MERKLHLLESFTARGPDGSSYKVCGYERLVRDESLVDGQEHWEPTGVFEYRLAEGDRVDVRNDGSMRIANSGVELSRTAAH